MKRSILTALALALTSLAQPADAQCVVTDGSGAAGVQCETLFAGQTIDAGTVCIEVVGTNLVVTYNTANGWELVETHVWIGDNLGDMPQTRKGNPKVGNFPYQSGDISGTTSWTLTVPLDNLGFSCPADDAQYYVAAHAAVQKPDGMGGYETETGWSDGGSIVDRGNWATVTSFVLSCDCDSTPPPMTGECETSFAYGGMDSTCFLDIDEDGDGMGDFSRWGWSNGPLTPGTYVLDMYAGAGQCDLMKGTYVGTVTINYDGTTATADWALLPGYTFDDAHFYAGTEVLPRGNMGAFTVAPGAYSVVRDDVGGATMVTAMVTGLSGDIYVVAHATVCGF